MPTIPLPNIFTAEMVSIPNKCATAPVPLSHDTFSFDSIAVAGFFGGDSSVAGMATVNLIPGRRWVGWYNNPGSYKIAKRYGPLGNSKVFDGLFPEGEHDPARLFKFDGRNGPKFVAAHSESGIVFQRTGFLGHLITRRAADMETTRDFRGTHYTSTRSPSVTIVNMQRVSDLSHKEIQPPLPDSWMAAWSIIPIAVSVGACVGCALARDWFCLTSIAVGIAAHGFACYVIGSGKLTFRHPELEARAVPRPGDGVLKGEREWVILIGTEGVVNAFTQGRFLIQYGRTQGEAGEGSSSTLTHHGKQGSDIYPLSLRSQSNQDNQLGSSPLSVPEYISAWIPPQWLIGVSAVFLMVQFIGQLLVIPHGTLFGQIMFIATVLASWIYNTFLSAIDRDEIQMKILSSILTEELKVGEEHMRKYEFNTSTAAVAFSCFVLASGPNGFKDPLVFLDAMLPSNTTVWKVWKDRMSKMLKGGVGTEANLFSHMDLNEVEKAWDSEKELLKNLFDEAEEGWRAWSEVRSLLFPLPEDDDDSLDFETVST